MIPYLTQKDACWLGKLKVMWEEDPEPGFVPPKSVREYLTSYPNGMRRAAGRLLRADAKITSQIWGERVVPVG